MAIKDIKEYWENCSSNYAHLGNDREILKGSNLHKLYVNSFLQDIDFKDKAVIDYGIGGGFLGKYLFENEGIEKYIGVDIAKRSLEKASETLEGFNFEMFETPVEFKGLNADIFVSIACIQHFPDIEYLNEFLRNINESEISTIVLQIRHTKRTKFRNGYELNKPVGRNCQTNLDFVGNRLFNYRLQKNKINEGNYQFMVFEGV